MSGARGRKTDAAKPGYGTHRGGHGLTRLVDRIAELVITVGGLTVLAAMVGICAFLIQSAAPLLASGTVADAASGRVVAESAGPIGAAMLTPRDGEVVMPCRDGTLCAMGFDGTVFPGVPFSTGPVTAWASDVVTGRVAAARADGVVVVASVDQVWKPVDPGVAAGLAPNLAAGGAVPLDGLAASPQVSGSPGARLVCTEPGVYRLWDLQFEGVFEVPVPVGVDQVAVHVESARRTWVAASGPGGEGGVGETVLLRIDRSRALGREAGAADVTRIALDDSMLKVVGRPDWLLLCGDGPRVVGVWRDGSLRHWAQAEDPALWSIVESRRATPEGVAVTAACMEIGSRTVLIGDESGSLRGFAIAPTGLAGGVGLVLRHERETGEQAITVLRPAGRDRTVAVGHADGAAELVNTTSGKVVARTPPTGDAVADLAVDGSLRELVVLHTGGNAAAYDIDPGHPEASVRSLLGRVHYEGYPGPRFVYQSTGGPGTEPKFSIMPLIFGTLKATLVAMLLSAPIAVLAALYTSEFLHPGVRRVVKPAIELMASLPSVVLGFVAAALVAPWLRDHLAGAMLAFTAAPAGVVLLSAVWRLVPERAARRVGTLPRIVIAACGLGLSIAAGVWLAGVIEPAMFALGDGQPGDARRWLDAEAGASWPGWMLLLCPPGVLGAMSLDARMLGGFWRRHSGRPGVIEGVRQIGRAAGIIFAGVAMAALLAAALSAVGMDPRDSVFGAFNQLNALVVGVVMGFAVAPIIYTISEDAMQSVPGTLRSASLAAGATPWQTAIKVVLPVAGPGVFSACMIGLGRAVGETMIVLMAAGGTPEMSANIFSGFRTLAANIAVELPEAPRGETHYRVLFLCGLVLFAMTLVVNTTAEIVRQRFRKRSAGL